jgi:hypothetical protein
MAELEQARSLFALRTIVLEMSQPEAAGPNSHRRWQHSRQGISMSKSSTGDMDSENLWCAAENDFSFFGEEGEEQDECGIYDHDPEKYFPTAHFDDKILLSPEDSHFENGSNSPHGSLHGHGTLSPFSMNFGNPTGTLQSPRSLPLGRNRRSSNDSQRSVEPKRLVAEISAGQVSPKFLHHKTHSQLRPAPTSSPQQEEPAEACIDVIAELAAWRKERKKAYEDELARYKSTWNGHGRSHSNSSSGPRGYGYGFDHGAGPGSIAFAQTNGNGNGRPETPSGNTESNDLDMKFVEGHWKGEIKVVRNAMPKGRSGMVDMYGNYFEKGYLYP